MLIGMSINQTFDDLERALSHAPSGRFRSAAVASLAMLATHTLRWFATGFLLGLGLEIAHALGG